MSLKGYQQNNAHLKLALPGLAQGCDVGTKKTINIEMDAQENRRHLYNLVQEIPFQLINLHAYFGICFWKNLWIHPCLSEELH